MIYFIIFHLGFHLSKYYFILNQTKSFLKIKASPIPFLYFRIQHKPTEIRKSLLMIPSKITQPFQ